MKRVRLAIFDWDGTLMDSVGRIVACVQAAARDCEEAALQADDAQALKAGLEQEGLRQERRALRLRPEGLAWEWPDSSVLRLSFALPPGSYATAVLHELGEVGEASRVVSDRLSEDR